MWSVSMGARARVRRLELEDFLTEIMDDRNMCAHADTSYIYIYEHNWDQGLHKVVC